MFKDFFPHLGNIIKTEYISILKGLQNTIIIALFAFLIGLVVGCIVSTIKLLPKKHNSYFLKFLETLSNIYLAIFRGTPIVVQLLFIYFGILIKFDAMTVAIIIMGLNSGAYVSEIMRGGILAIDKGQMEAGRSLGLSYSQTMVKIILPQGIKNSIPNLANEFITLLKETSVVGFVTVMDLTFTIKSIVAGSFQYVEGYFLLGVIYFIIVYIATKLIQLLERRLRRSDNR